MKHKTAPSCPVTIFVAGDYGEARTICRAFCDEEGLCVTVTPTLYVYTDGEEAGVIVGLINYPRFPSTPGDILTTAKLLALELMSKMEQESVSIQTPTLTHWYSARPADLALALLDSISEPLTDCVGECLDAQRIEARSDETPAEAVQPEGREPGPKDAPQRPHPQSES